MKPLLSLLFLMVLVSKSLQVAVKECTDEGIFCETCQHLVHCQKTQTGNFTKATRQTCHPRKCLKGNCIDSPEPICDGIADVQFVCKNVGIFPHPFYCNKFVMCAHETMGLKTFIINCESGYGYNIATAACDKMLNNNQCKELEYPVPLCQNPLQSGPLKEDKRIYYTCEYIRTVSKKVLYPVLRVCPHGQIYDIKKLCHDTQMHKF